MQITTSNPDYGDPHDRVTLSKWWPGGRATYHITSQSQWERIAEIISDDLGPFLGWETAEKLAAEAASKGAKPSSSEAFRSLLEQHPDFLKRLVESLDPKKMGQSSIESLMNVFGEIADAYAQANMGFRHAFLNVVKKLPKQKQRALEDLDLLLQGWSLQVVTNVAQQVRARLETIELFEKQINDARTYEIKGDNSIHRILERAMWLVDEHYWLLFSNKTLLKQIGAAMEKSDKQRYGKQRPDFVCGSVGDRLIILELKRPSHKLTIEDLNQLETYVTVAERYSSFRSYRAYLVGSSKDDELDRRLKHRSNAFRIMTYADLLDATRKRYHEFLHTLDG